MLKLKFLLAFILIGSVCAENTDNTDTANNKVDSQEKIRKDSKPQIKFESGFYTGLGIGGVLKSLTNVKETKTSNEAKNDEKINIKKNAFDVNLLIGYDKSFGSILFGTEFDLGKQIGSTMQYSFKNIKIADITQNWNCSGFVKVGVVFDTWTLCGLVGGQLSSIKYKWEQTTHPDLEKQKKLGFIYGAMLEKQFSNRLAIRVGYTRNNKVEHSNTSTKVNVNSTEKELSDVQIAANQITLGFLYRF